MVAQYLQCAIAAADAGRVGAGNGISASIAPRPRAHAQLYALLRGFWVSRSQRSRARVESKAHSEVRLISLQPPPPSRARARRHGNSESRSLKFHTWLLYCGTCINGAPSVEFSACDLRR